MKILVIWKWLSIGGINTGWRNRAAFFAKNGITTDFLYLYDGGGSSMMDGIAKVYLTEKQQEIMDIINTNEYQAIIVVDLFHVYPMIRESGYQGVVIIESRTPQKSYIQPHLENFHGLTPSLIIVPSHYQGSLVQTIIGHRLPIEVIYNGIDTELFQPITDQILLKEKPPRIPRQKKIIAWIGRIDQRKNWKFLLQVAHYLLKIRSDVEFWVIGGERSKKRPEFKEMRKHLGLKNHLRWFPVIPYNQMPLIYSKVRYSGGCTFSTAKEESFGNTFIESMACGCPVVAPENSAIPELITHDITGLLYIPNDLTNALTCLNRILNDKSLRKKIKINSLESVKTNFTIEKSASRYVDLLMGSDSIL